MRKFSINSLIVGCTTIVIFLITISAIFLYPLTFSEGSTVGFLNFLFRIGAAIAILLFAFQLGKSKNIKNHKAYFVTFIIVALFCQLVFLSTFSRPVYTDTGYVTTMAGRLIDGNHNWYQYFFIYPNNVNVVLFWRLVLTPFHWIGVTNYELILPWIQMLMLDIGIFYLSRSLKIFSKPLSSIFLLVALFYTPWFMYAIFPYNDVIAIALIMGVIGSFVRLLNSNSNQCKWLHGFMMMLMLGVAVTIRQNSVIILIALLLTVLFSKQFTKQLKFGLLVLGILFSLIGTLSFHQFQSSEGFHSKPNLVTPSVRYVNMSWNPNTSGQIDGPDSFLYSNYPKKERSKLITAELKHRIKNLGVIGIPKHAIKKIAFMFSLAYSNEDMGGIQIKPPLLKNEWQAEPFLEMIGNLFQPVYIVLLLSAGLITLYVLKNRKSVNDTIFNLTVFSAFSIVGIFTFHILLWEVRDRYALPMIPFLLILAAVGLKTFFDIARNQIESNKVKKRTSGIAILALLFLLTSFGVSLSQSQKQVTRTGSVYYSGFSMYTENENELVSIPGHAIVKTDVFRLKSSASEFNIDFSKLSREDLKHIKVTLVRTDKKKSWNIKLMPATVTYYGNFSVGKYQLKIENNGQNSIKTNAVQNVGTTNIQGPKVMMNNHDVKGLNTIFNFTDIHVTRWMNLNIYIFVHFIFIVMLLTVILSIEKKEMYN
ncbi:AdipoR/hemolysin III family protein [Fructobacillus ficulneus]|uniref:Glycosyltransferase RgtA/B/C/D-like domain-containing protein n=1 Tax=Fructobacillus ficulneus TaxID=157463 RepID=A0A0K8MF02_9LACO|nr:hypothetical protein [Fructobacillus ficulneus]GAO99111.1 hypothetical protein FFIC_010160 [Fructobacillus ficulneus]